MMKSYRKWLIFSLCFLSLISLVSANESNLTEDFWDGEQYLNNSSLQYRWAISYIEKLHLKGNEKILDIGCGDGRVTAMIAQAVPNGQVLGVDNSESMIQTAQDFLKKIHLTNLNFAKKDAVSLNFENEFDYIVSFSCFHWISNHLAALQEIEKGLRSGGKVFLYFGPDYGCNRIDHAIEIIARSSKWGHYFHDFSNSFFLVTPTKFATHIGEANLQLKRMEIIEVDEAFPTKEAFAEWLKGCVTYLKKIPKELHQEFLEEIIDYYLSKRPIDNEGRIHYIDYWMEVELIKSS